MSLYLREMNHQVWWMVDIALSHTLDDCPQTQGQKKCLYLEAQASNTLSSALSAEIKDEIEMEYLSKCMAQAIAKDHHQVLQKIYHHLYIVIKIKKSNQVFKKN
jgi:U3 small nucleolar ribonucleoprotein component